MAEPSTIDLLRCRPETREILEAVNSSPAYSRTGAPHSWLEALARQIDATLDQCFDRLPDVRRTDE